MSNIKMNYESLGEFWGQIPELDHVISLVGTMEEQEKWQNSYESVGDLGISITNRSITLVNIGAAELPTVNELPIIGELRLFKGGELSRIYHYLKAYLITNRDFLEPEQITELCNLLESVK